MINLTTLVGLLSGSLATLFIKEIINQFTKRQEFKRELSKFTYEKKLEKAENAIAYYWTYVNKIVEMKKSFELIIGVLDEFEETDKDIQIILDMVKKNSEYLIELSAEKYVHINAIHLYFELEEFNKWNENDLADLLSALSETKSVDNELSFWNDLYNNALNGGDNKLAEVYWKKAMETLPNYKIGLQKYLNSVEKNKIAVNSMIINIKKELKSY